LIPRDLVINDRSLMNREWRFRKIPGNESFACSSDFMRLDVHVVHGGATIVSRLVTRVCHRCANDMKANEQPGKSRHKATGLSKASKHSK
jgi:hypothetical protein